MKLILKAMMLGALLRPGVTYAQSWSHGQDRATAPRSIAGNATSGFEIVCFQGHWSLYLFTATSPNGGGGAATIIIDGNRFDTRFDLRPPAADEGLIVNLPIVDALKAGRQVEITFPKGGTPYSATFSLRGSSRALSAVEAGCTIPTPATTPNRFIGASGESDPEAVALLRNLLADRLARMRAEANNRDIDVQGAWFVDLDNGWRFISADIGFSNYHFGMSQFGSTVCVQPPNRDWQQAVWLASGAAVAIDRQGSANGYPDIFLKNVRGVNQPYALWQWTGSEYAFRRRVPN